MPVIIGVDPHKATHTAVVIDRSEVELARAKVRASGRQVPQLLDWAEPLGERTWAVESADGLGYLLSQQLIRAGETVVDVPSTLAARIRVLGTGRSDKNDPNDALSVAIAALRTPGLRQVTTADHTAILRLLAKRNVDIGNQRSRVVCRLHSLCMELSPGGITKELNASDAVALLDRIAPTGAAELARHDQALELLADIQRLDEQLKASHRRVRRHGVEHDAHRRVRDRPDPGLLPDRVHRRHRPVLEPRQLRRLQRHRTRRTLLGRPGRPSRLPAREPTPEPRAPHDRDLSDPPSSRRGTGVLRTQGRRGQDQEGRHPFPQATHL